MSNRLVVTLIAGFAFGVVLPGLQGCVEPNPDHCVNNRGDDYCAQRHPDWPNAYCSDNSCVDEITTDGCQQEIPLGCWFCAGKDDPDDDVPECSDMAEGDGDGDGDMGDGDGDGVGDDDGAGNGDGDGEGDMPCTGPEDCTSPDARFCDVSSGTCVNCAGTSEPDESCAGFDGAAPVCLAGECVACAEGKTDACTGITPVCDTGANVCVGCSNHDQCSDTACNFAAGNCLDPANIIHVAGSDEECDDDDDDAGSEATPFCTISAALINSPVEPLIILHELNGDAPYVEHNVVMITAALFGADGELPRLEGLDGNPALTVAAQGKLIIRNVQLSGSPDFGLVINGGDAWIDRSRIVNNDDGGISLDNGGSLVLTNSFVGGIQSKPMLNLVEGQFQVLYSTLGGGYSDSRALVCAEGTGSGSSVRNSIIVSYSEESEYDCDAAQIDASFTETETAFDDNSNWFIDYDDGDFHLDANNYPPAIATTAIWAPGDPTTDIDGDLRPTGPDFAGADRVP
jgi:hypothetical protein